MTDAELVILHLLSEKPRHGYEIEEVIELRGMREWTAIGFSSIYYVLKKLEKTGLVDKRSEEAERGPSRKVFRLTPAGHQALRQAALDSLARHQGDYQTLLMGLANLPLLSRQEALAALSEHRQGLTERRRHIDGRRQAQQPLPGTVQALFDYSFTMIDARLQWLTAFIDDIESGRFSWPGLETQGKKNDDPTKDRLEERAEGSL
jgi:DNA-binding PadR family transcriptional regulator